MKKISGTYATGKLGGLEMQVNVTANIDPNIIAARTPKADHILAVQAAKDTTPFVPMRTGTLRNSTQVSGGTITYPGPCAHYLWNGIVFVDPKTGYAGIPTMTGWFSRKGVTKVPSGRKLNIRVGQSHWFDASKAMNMGKWLRVYGRALNSGK